jgi:hypothetical protein
MVIQIRPPQNCIFGTPGRGWLLVDDCGGGGRGGLCFDRSVVLSQLHLLKQTIKYYWYYYVLSILQTEGRLKKGLLT